MVIGMEKKTRNGLKNTLRNARTSATIKALPKLFIFTPGVIQAARIITNADKTNFIKKSIIIFILNESNKKANRGYRSLY